MLLIRRTSNSEYLYLYAVHMNTCNVTIKHFSFHVNRTDQVTRKPNNEIKINKRGVFGLSVLLSKFFIVAMTYLLTPWSRVLLEKLTSKLCS